MCLSGMTKLMTFPNGFRVLGLIVSCVWWFCGGAPLWASAETSGVLPLPRSDSVRDLILAAFAGDGQKTSVLLSNGVDANARTGPGLAAWQAAKVKGHADIMDLLAQAGANTNATLPKAEAILDWYVKEELGRGSPGLALALIRDGNLAFERGWGLANLEYDVPITPTTVFHVASVSKQFTAFAIARLIQQGKLSLEDDILKYLPEMHDCGATITVRHLLSHTSGLRDQWMLLGLARKNNGGVVSQAEVLKLLERQRELLFVPGENFLYCNSGYTLLSEIVARVSGQIFWQFYPGRDIRAVGNDELAFPYAERRGGKEYGVFLLPCTRGRLSKSALELRDGRRNRFIYHGGGPREVARRFSTPETAGCGATGPDAATRPAQQR
jgi:CubicO group peptidase (beta-lactamase class C family)